jgi:hypothetical protein
MSYCIEITVAASPDEILATIRNPRSWWSEGITGSAGAAGDEFDYRYGTVHYCRVRIAESGPQRVVWEILENEFGVVDGEDEWVGTRCVFDLVPGQGSTVLRFTHDGLYPHFSCYDVCSQGWDHYIGSSLAAALTDGQGHPTRRTPPGPTTRCPSNRANEEPRAFEARIASVRGTQATRGGRTHACSARIAAE